MLPGRASAQDLAQPPCPAGTGLDPRRVTQDACTQAFDVFQFVAPQLSIALVGGNAVIGQSSTLGGLGHFSVGVRANAIRGVIPDITEFGLPSNQGAQRRVLPTFEQYLPLPTADAAIGIFGGVPLGIGTVGGVDLLLSAAYVPTLEVEGVSIEPEENLQIGYGARLGLLEETLVLPGVSASFLKRDLPSMDISGSYSNVTITITDAKAETTAWRLVVGKNLLIFGIAAGVGRESYALSANASATVSGFTATVPGAEQSLSRTNYFVDASLNLPLLKIAAELGQVTGGTVQTYNSFEGGRADRSLTYASLGVRLGL
jgi:hypothetical protein